MNRRSFHALTLAAGASRLLSAEETQVPRIKIGQIGTRHTHASGQFAALRECGDFEIVGVAEPDEAQRQRAQASSTYQGVRWMSEEELLNTPGLQAVAVETEVGQLLNHAEKVAKAGLHLHLDKPAGESLPQFRRILETCAQKKRLVKMGYMFRFNPAFQFSLKAAHDGWLGQVFSVHAEMSKKASAAERANDFPYKGGSMFELGCHLIDSVVFLLGKPQKVTSFPRSFPHDGYNDNMVAVLEYPETLVTLRVSMMEPDGGPRRQFVICGDHGSCEIRPLEPPALKLMLDAPHGDYKKGVHDIPLPKAPRYAADWAGFAKAIRGEWEWPWKPEHDLATQETILRASGMPVG